MSARHDAAQLVDEFFDVFEEWKKSLKGREFEEGAVVWGIAVTTINQRLYKRYQEQMNQYNNHGVTQNGKIVKQD